jgi:YggT family protein
MLLKIVNAFFTVYQLMLFARIIGSYLPQFYGHPVMRFIAYYTDPYLGLFRRIVPPIGGILDLSPILAFIGLGIIEHIIKTLLVGL